MKSSLVFTALVDWCCSRPCQPRSMRGAGPLRCAPQSERIPKLGSGSGSLWERVPPVVPQTGVQNESLLILAHSLHESPRRES